MPTEPRRNLVMAFPSLHAEVPVELHWSDAPTLCSLIWQELPFDSVPEHGFLTGAMIFAPTRISTSIRENRRGFTEMPIGACYFANASQNVGFVYGPVTEPQAQCVWGSVPEAAWPAMREIGQAIWRNTMAPFGDPRLNPSVKRIVPMTVRRT